MKWSSIISKLMEFFTKDKITKLIEYATELPQENDGISRVFKYPFVSSEILSCDSPVILDMFLEESKDYNIPVDNDKQYLLTLKFKKELISKIDNKQNEDRGMEAKSNAEWSQPADDEVEILEPNSKESQDERINEEKLDPTKSNQQIPAKELKLKSVLRTEPKSENRNKLADRYEMLELEDEFKDNQQDEDAGKNYEEEFDRVAKEEIQNLNDNDEFCQNEGFDIFKELEDENRVNQAILKNEEEERIKEAQSSNEDNLFTK